MCSDHELMRKTGQGDSRAFEQLVLRHQDLVWSLVYRFTNNSSDAEELAQESFLKIFRTAGRYTPSAQFTTFLYRVVVNTCLDYTRKRETEDLGEHTEESPLPATVVENREKQEGMEKALQSLPDRQKMAVVLHYFEDFSLREIADYLDTTPKGVERLLSRARRKLENILNRLR